jgi:nucleoside-diphosphate-sugar epimerase
VIPTIVSQLLAGADTLHLGSVDPVRDLLYVEDTTRGFLRAGVVEQAIGQVINLGTGQGISIADLARVIMGIVGREVPIVHDAERVRPEASEVRVLVAKYELARQILGWEPQVTLAEGLRKVAESIGSNMVAYRVGTYVI